MQTVVSKEARSILDHRNTDPMTTQSGERNSAVLGLFRKLALDTSVRFSSERNIILANYTNITTVVINVTQQYYAS